MPNPKRRHTRARRDTRRAQNWKLEVINLSKCPNCGAARLPHRICPACGYYKDRVVLAKKDKPTQEAQTK
jgi:large subunit ribosomal protein L32